MTDDTVLRLHGIGVPEYSTRAATQTLKPIGASQHMRRTINGTLVNLAEEQFQKYESTINCEDMRAPAVSGKWPGQQVTVHCIQELCEPVGNTEVDEETEVTEGTLQRTPVPGSLRVEGEFVFYRPILIMKVRDFNLTTSEWAARVGWTMQLEEV